MTLRTCTQCHDVGWVPVDALPAPFLCASCVLWIGQGVLWRDDVAYIVDPRDHQEGVGVAYVVYFPSGGTVETTRLRVTEEPPPWVNRHADPQVIIQRRT